MIPKEAVGELCLLVRIDDLRSKFWIGVIRTAHSVLRIGEIRDKILSHRESGQARINELFRLVQGRIIPRIAIETVAQQKDSMKRARDARKLLKSEGILVLGHQGIEPEIAASRGYPVPEKGEMISIRENDLE